VADDDWGFCQLVERYLKTGDDAFVVRRAYDGRRALEAMHARKPDLLILDLIMPEIDGFEVLNRIREDPRFADVPVLLLTATSYVEDALSQRGDRITVHRSDGLSPPEVLRCLGAIVDTLKPHYDERSASPEAVRGP
jgi:CheY-like chemotaxis protein